MQLHTNLALNMFQHIFKHFKFAITTSIIDCGANAGDYKYLKTFIFKLVVQSKEINKRLD